MYDIRKYFSLRIFCGTFACSLLLTSPMLYKYYHNPKENISSEKQYNTQINIYNINTKITSDAKTIKLNLSEIVSKAKHQELFNTKIPDVLYISVTSDNDEISKPRVVKEKKRITKRKIKVRVKKKNKSHKIYKIVENGMSYKLETKYQNYLWKMCKKYKVTKYYKMLMAQMYHESGFNQNCISSTSDYGLMQINSCNHKWLSKKLGKNNFLNPYTSIEAGVYMMSGYLKKYNDVQMALVCYNMGESRVRKGTYSTVYSRGVLRDMRRMVELKERSNHK